MLLGGAFAVCAAPCIGTVLASILVLASSSGGVARGVVLLLAYSLGLGAAFVARRSRLRPRHARVPLGALALPGVRIASGSTLIVLGLLLFFNRDWWLRIALDQVFAKIGLATS